MYDALHETLKREKMPDEILLDTALALSSEWNLQTQELISEEALLKLLAQKITEILAQGSDAFFQLMYRLDVSERKLNEVIGDEDAADKIARLVYDRQLAKIRSRHLNRQNKDNIDPDLKW
jgi:hypothetical protein